MPRAADMSTTSHKARSSLSSRDPSSPSHKLSPIATSEPTALQQPPSAHPTSQTAPNTDLRGPLSAHPISASRPAATNSATLTPTPTSASSSTNPHSNSNASSQPLTSRSASSFSTVHSDPFLHAEDLDTTYHWIPSFYLEDRRDGWAGSAAEGASGPSVGCRGSDTASAQRLGSEAAAAAAAEEAEGRAARRARRRLREAVARSSLQDALKARFLALERIVCFVGARLFPPGHALREDVRMDLGGILHDVGDFLDRVLEQVTRRIGAAEQVMAKLPRAESQDHGLDVRIREWIGTLDSLHAPTGTEAAVFRHTNTLFSTLVYSPFLQLRRSEPAHNIRALDADLASVSSQLKRAEAGARKADALVLETEKAFEDAMVGDMKGKGHAVSVSAPVVVVVAATPALWRRRQRENTV